MSENMRTSIGSILNKLPLLIVYLLVYTNLQCTKNNIVVESGLRPKFQFEVLSEYYSVGGRTQSVQIYLPRDNYKEGYLKELFTWYTKLHPNKNDCLDIQIYTNPEIRNKDIKPLSIVYDASYWRTCDSECNSEGFRYLLDPDKDSNEEKQVVLRGCVPHLPPDDLKYWNYLNDTFKVRYRAFDYQIVEPKGTYYAFEQYDKEFDEWECIFTLQRDEVPTEPEAKARVVLEKVAYTFLGWKYAVTVDSGKTWQVWDGEDAIPEWQCCDGNLIQAVQVSKDGAGEMSVQPDKPKPIFKLYTKDYGQHWNREN
jgi:hypothetical protein